MILYGTPYRREYLFGPPGTGKSSKVTSLAAVFNLNICLVNLASKELNDDDSTCRRHYCHGRYSSFANDVMDALTLMGNKKTDTNKGECINQSFQSLRSIQNSE